MIPIEELLVHVRRKTTAGIGNADDDLLVRLPGSQTHDSSLWGVAQRIVEEVQQDLAETERVCRDEWTTRLHIDGHRDVPGPTRERAHDIGDGLQQGSAIQRAQRESEPLLLPPSRRADRLAVVFCIASAGSSLLAGRDGAIQSVAERSRAPGGPHRRLATGGPTTGRGIERNSVE